MIKILQILFVMLFVLVLIGIFLGKQASIGTSFLCFAFLFGYYLLVFWRTGAISLQISSPLALLSRVSRPLGVKDQGIVQRDKAPLAYWAWFAMVTMLVLSMLGMAISAYLGAITFD